MMKKILSFIAVFALAASVMSGGDDRDMGPVESLDSMAPIADQVLGHTISGAPVTAMAHELCKDKLGFTDYNIAAFKDALAGGFLYNIGPINTIGTLFSPERWISYFTCVEGIGS